MTTETLHPTRNPGARVLLGSASAALLTSLVIAGVGLLAEGRAAAYGALVGSALVLLVFGLGTFAVDTVATVLPAASLLVALLTYTLQVVLMGLVFWGLAGSGVLGSTLDARWLSGAVIASTLTWIVVQILRATRLRIPAYDLGVPAPTGGEV